MRVIKEIRAMVHFLVVLLAAMTVGSALGVVSDQNQITAGTAIIALFLLAVADAVITGPMYLMERRSRN